MKNLSFFVVCLLFVALAGCSSGSSNESGSTASTNTEPTSNTEPTTNDFTDSGTSTGPSDDQPNSAGDVNGTSNEDGDDTVTDTNGGTDSTASTAESNDPLDTPDGDNSDNTSVAAGNDDAVVTDDTSNDTDGGDTAEADAGSNTDAGTDSSGGSDTDGGGDTTSGSVNADAENTDTVIDPDSALGGLQSRIKTLTGRTLLALNRSLSQGEMLSAQQEQCLGTYDPAIGEPLLSIDCDQPLATGEVPIFASVASLNDTPECRTSLQNDNTDACSINQAEFSISPIFTTPEMGRPEVKQAGAAVSYNIVQDRLIVENLTPPLTGTFFCEYDLTTGNAVGGDPGGSCYNQINRICDLIDEQLAIEN